MWSREHGTPFKELAILRNLVKPKRKPVPEIPLGPKDDITIFRTKITNICGSNNFETLTSPEINCPEGFEPRVSFSAQVSPTRLPPEIRQFLDLDAELSELVFVFGSEVNPDKIFLFLGINQKGVILKTELNEDEWETTSLFYSGDKANPISLSPSVFSEAARFAEECAEQEVRSRQAT